MQYVHVRSLEKYHPGYKDRDLRWAKICFNMVQGDPDCELITNEIDWARLIKFIILELQARKPVPLDDRYLASKGFDLEKRPIDQTLKMLHNFLDVVTQLPKVCSLEKSKRREREEKEGTDRAAAVTEIHRLWNDLCQRQPTLSAIQKVSGGRMLKLRARMEDKLFCDFGSIIKAIEQQPFLLGENNRKWRVSFDWLISNDTNYVKILEGKYKDDHRDALAPSLRHLRRNQ